MSTLSKLNPFYIFDHDTRLHLRLPFSFFLLPVFCFGISQAASIHLTNTIIVFIALHVFIYPGSNIYNSYMDDDTGSIGGIENPPPATPKLYHASIIFDTIGLILCLFAGWQNMLLMAGYVAFSKGYSWHGIRFKKYPYLGWFSVMFFQGGYTYLLANMAAENLFDASWFTNKNLICMLVASLLIGGSYPLTQIYQHDEDGSRGDFTISYILGITGTFLFAGGLFLLGSVVIALYFLQYYNAYHIVVYLLCLSPVIIYFSNWFLKSLKNKTNVNYHNAMRMNRVSAICMILCFTIILLLNQHII